MSAVITGLLQQIDRLLAVEGVVLIAATNAPQAIDPAIRRSGRFDTKLALAAPTRAGHEAILTRHLGLAVEAATPIPRWPAPLPTRPAGSSVALAPTRRHLRAPHARSPAPMA